MIPSTADRQALADLVHRYAAGVDDRRLGDVAALFTDDAELILPNPPASLEPVTVHRGRLAIAEAVAAVAAVERTAHAIVGEVYEREPDPDAARGRIACIAHHWLRRGDRIEAFVWYARYDDSYARTVSGWRIARRVLSIDAIERRHLAQLRPG